MRSRYKLGDGSIDRARKLRQESTSAESMLWSILRGSQIAGHKFRRQQRIGPFFADFVCQAARLVIEVDGDTHAHSQAQDVRRTFFLNQQGYQVLRFANQDVIGNPEGVFHAIRVALAPSPSHSALPSGPLPLPQGERRS